MVYKAESIPKEIWARLVQVASSVGWGLFLAFEATAIYFNIALLVIIVDVISAFALGRRVARRYPDKADGKFKSEYKFRILFTFIIFMLAIMAGYMVDTVVIQESNKAVSFVVFAFIFYEVWSICENWSSENDNLLARVMQKVMINKVDRHFNLEVKEAIKEVKDELKEEKEKEL